MMKELTDQNAAMMKELADQKARDHAVGYMVTECYNTIRGLQEQVRMQSSDIDELTNTVRTSLRYIKEWTLMLDVGPRGAFRPQRRVGHPRGLRQTPFHIRLKGYNSDANATAGCVMERSVLSSPAELLRAAAEQIGNLVRTCQMRQLPDEAFLADDLKEDADKIVRIQTGLPWYIFGLTPVSEQTPCLTCQNLKDMMTTLQALQVELNGGTETLKGLTAEIALRRSHPITIMLN
jgi:hypothetical protein